MDSVAGEAVSVKLAVADAVTVSETLVVWVTPPPVPVMVMGYVPAAVVEATLKVALEEPEPPLMGLVPKVTVTPEGIPDAVRVTDELKPLEGVAVMVEAPLDPAATEREDGEADSAKDG